MPETFNKVDDNSVEITTSVLQVVVTHKSLEELEVEVVEAEAVLARVLQAHQDEIAIHQEIIAKLKHRETEAKKLGIKKKEVVNP